MGSIHVLILSTCNSPSRTQMEKILEPYPAYIEIMLRFSKLNRGNKEQRLADLPYISESERQRILLHLESGRTRGKSSWLIYLVSMVLFPHL